MRKYRCIDRNGSKCLEATMAVTASIYLIRTAETGPVVSVCVAMCRYYPILLYSHVQRQLERTPLRGEV